VFFIRKFDLAADDANFVNSLIYIVSGVASPILGLVMDKTGRNVFWVTISIIVTIGSHSLLAFTFLNPFIAMVIRRLDFVDVTYSNKI
jgi:MFS family permease